MLYLQAKLFYCMKKRAYSLVLFKILHNLLCSILEILYIVFRVHPAHSTKSRLDFFEKRHKKVILSKINKQKGCQLCGGCRALRRARKKPFL